MFAEAKAESIEILSEVQLAEIANDLWDWSSTIDANDTDVRFCEKHGSHYLEVIGPDRPFLVDSLLGACTTQGIEVRALFHPILEIAPDQYRSLIQIHLPALTKTERQALLENVHITLNDVAMVTSDHQGMRSRMAREVERLAACPHITDDQKTEAIAFLNWLSSEHFVFLGVRDYTFHTDDDGDVLPEEPETVEGSNLGILRDDSRNVLNRGAEPLVLNRAIGEFLAEPEPLILAKSTLVSRVHRTAVCDYIGVKHFNEHGKVKGETRFLGLYTSEAYNNSVRDVPLIRLRAKRVVDASGAKKGTHDEKALWNILESWPRDELFQTNSRQLTPIMLGALHLIGRPRVRLFIRPDRFNRFVSAIVFVPREAYDTRLRERISRTLEDAYGGRLAHFEPSFDGAALVRVLFEIALPIKAKSPDIDALEAELAAIARTWDDRFRNALRDNLKDPETQNAGTLFAGAFNAAYREAFDPEEAIKDVAGLAAINAEHPVKLRAFRHTDDDPSVIRAKIYARNGAIALSDCVPVFERMGLFVDFETGYPVEPKGKPVPDAPDVYWVHALQMRLSGERAADLDQIGAIFEDAFVAVWSGQAENDGFNALVFNAGMAWHEAALCRTLCAYRHQTGLDPARSIQIEALNSYPDIARKLVDLFAARFDPDEAETLSDRRKVTQSLRADIENSLKAVGSLDHDRVIRRLADLVSATQRTNFYQRNKDGSPRPYIAIKIASRELTDLPAPKPYREIFMSSPLVEGVHCRFGAVARGGLRWSDRREDFRTEVLGLVKAQQVKNAVIVPVGSKGGFFPKQLPIGGSREAIREGGIAAYRSFITSLLDLTDNLIDGKVQHPEQTVIWDGEDPYLVVAADKGTATFSDIANEISQAHGFWLGDAFASGGSVGYDHKKMGITARGAWEAVKRHFREIGTDIQTEPFTVIGCGDMSGDVFGNGMLLSKQIRLQAAFNHMHIFIDPDPQDPERLWDERKRMFNLPRSSWMDYDQSLISEGGGIFDRSAKAIELTPEIKALTGLKAETITPDELIKALLQTPCDLLWFGGIGTYIKAGEESHAEVGDKGNDGLRINGKQVGAKVIGEGANLGLTQAARIEFAQAGGRINTDAIDNSAGVDSSDHEVNIKILCTEAMRRGALPTGERNTLLASMTDDVAEHVLRHNYAQTAALSVSEDQAKADHDALERLMLKLEARGVLDREVEGLPSSAEMRDRGESGQPLTRPELAVLMAWTKIILFDDLVQSEVPDDPYFHATLQGYFPEALHAYDDAMQAHRLKREIIATVLANRLIDASGPVFLLRLREQTGADNAALTAAFEIARAVLEAESIQDQINALDNQVPAKHQIALQESLSRALLNLTSGLARTSITQDIAAQIERLTPVASGIRAVLPSALSSYETSCFTKGVKAITKAKIDKQLASQVEIAAYLNVTAQVSAIADDLSAGAGEVYAAYQTVGEAMGLDRLRGAASTALRKMPYWDRLATRRQMLELQALQLDAVRLALKSGGTETWLAATQGQRRALIAEMRAYTVNAAAFAQFALAADAARQFMQSVHKD